MQRQHRTSLQFRRQLGGQSVLVAVARRVTGERPVEVRVEIPLARGQRFLVGDDELDRAVDVGRVREDGLDTVAATRFVTVDAADDGD